MWASDKTCKRPKILVDSSDADRRVNKKVRGKPLSTYLDSGLIRSSSPLQSNSSLHEPFILRPEPRVRILPSYPLICFPRDSEYTELTTHWCLGKIEMKQSTCTLYTYLDWRGLVPRFDPMRHSMNHSFWDSTWAGSPLVQSQHSLSHLTKQTNKPKQN